MKTLHSFQHILKKVEDTVSFQSVVRQLEHVPQVAVRHCAGSLGALVAALLWKRSVSHVVVLCANDEQAEYMRNDLAHIIGAEHLIWYAEPSKKIALDAELLDTHLVSLTGALGAISAVSHSVVLTTSASVLEPVPAPQELTNNRIQIQRGAGIDFQEFTTMLISSGFNRKDFVETTVVPIHSGETIGPGLLAQILRDCEMSRDDVRALL